MFEPLYFDNNATSKPHPKVLQAVLPYLEGRFGNASSRHEYGRRARAAIDRARQQLADALGAHPSEVIFTSGGSEANNLFLKGSAAFLDPGALLAFAASEHPCVRESMLRLKRQGFVVREIALQSNGVILEKSWRQVLASRPAMLAVMLANNETGVIQDIPRLAAEAKAAGALMLTDAVQAFAKIPLNFRELGVHGLSVSGHKLGALQGAGALVVDKRVELRCQIDGGGQERGLRSGTENLAAIVSLGEAAELALSELAVRAGMLVHLRATLEQALLSMGAIIFGQQAPRLPGTSFFGFAGVDGETLVGRLDRAGFAVASGSACSSASVEPSATLLAMGVSPELARTAVRVSFGADNTIAEVEQFIGVLGQMLEELRRLVTI